MGKMDKKRSAISKIQIHIFLWGMAAVMLFFSILDFHGAIILKNYRCVEGKVINVEATKVLQRQGYVTRYNYKIVWSDNGVQHQKSVYEAVDCPDESQTKVWVNADNTNVALGDSESAKRSGYITLGIAILVFILGLLFTPKKDKRRKMSVDNMETLYYMAILSAIGMVFGDVLIIFFNCSMMSKHIYVVPQTWDLAGAFTIILIISIVTIVKLKKQLK